MNEQHGNRIATTILNRLSEIGYEVRESGSYAKLEAEAQALRDQVKALQSDANSYQSGYDEGRRMGTKHRQDEVEQLTREVAALRARVVVPDGHALVPVELTRDMWVAVNKEDDKAFAGGCNHGAQFDWLWQAAIDAAPRLNGKVVSEGLLRRITAEPVGGAVYDAIAELRDLLGKGKEDGHA